MTESQPLAWLPRSEYDHVLASIPDRYDRIRAFATLCRINSLYMITQAGSGHIGSSFSAIDIVSWLLLVELNNANAPDGDVYFSSKGHDVPSLYAAYIGLGYLDEGLVHRLRRLGGLPGHPDVGTPCIPFNTGSLGMGISKAKGLIMADRLAGRRRKVFVLTGDGELQEGQIWESLPSAARHAMTELTVLVDHNKIQSDTWVSDVSDLGDLAGKFRSYGWGVLRCDGHDLQALEEALRQRTARYPDRPAVIIADTVKGAGVERFASTSLPPDQWRYRFHSGAPEPGDYLAAYAELKARADALLARYGARALAADSTASAFPARRTGQPTWRLPEVYGRALVEAARLDQRVVALDADLVLDTGLIPFRDAFPGRFIECGIAEQDMVSMAGGLAAGGLLPFVHSFSCFLHARPNEQIYNNATEHRRVIYVGSLAGLTPAGPGHSHQAVRDIAALSAIPGLTLLAPASPTQTENAVSYCLTSHESVYLRLASVPVPPEVMAMPTVELVPGRGQVVREGGGTVVAIGAGPVILGELLRAAEILAADGMDMTIINMPWLNRLDSAWLAEISATAEWLVVVEEHYERGGQADMFGRALLELGSTQSRRLPGFRGIGLARIPECGTAEEVLGAHGLRADLLANILKEGFRTAPAAERVPERRHIH